jgi:hypothetical protein
MRSLMFSNPMLENSFRRMVKQAKDEIGGYFMIKGFEPSSWLGKFSWRKIVNAIGSTDFVEDVIIVPNKATKPRSSWMTWSMDLAQELAWANAKLKLTWPIHFHTHPNNSEQPSPNDLAFAGHWCQKFTGCSMFCIVTPHPLRIWRYSLDYGRVSTPENGSLEIGKFYSWRMNIVKGLVNGETP